MTERATHNVDIDSFYPLFQSRADKLRLVLETMGHEPLHGLDFAVLAAQDHIREMEAKLLAIKELPKLTTRFALGGSTTVVLWDDVEAILNRRAAELEALLK